MSKAGKFQIQVNGPYPCWCRLQHGEHGDLSHWISFTHQELSDLQYAVEKAMQEARMKLKPMNQDHEV